MPCVASSRVIFRPYQVSAADGRDTGTVTGYYEPLLAGSRTRTERYTVPLYAAPDDLLTIDLTALYPELKDKRLRGRVEGRRVVPYWPRADIANGRAPGRRPGAGVRRGPGRGVLPGDPGLGSHPAPGRQRDAPGYADQNGQPYRSIGRVLIERGELTLEARVDAGHSRLGAAGIRQAAGAARREPELRVLPRGAAPGARNPRGRDRRAAGHARRAAARGRAIAVDTRSVPLGAPVFLATTWPLSRTPLQRLVLAQDTGGAIRGAVRADFFWGFGDDAGRQAGRMRQDGRMWILWPKEAPPPAPNGAR